MVGMNVSLASPRPAESSSASTGSETLGSEADRGDDTDSSVSTRGDDSFSEDQTADSYNVSHVLRESQRVAAKADFGP